MKGMFDLLMDETFHCKRHFTCSEYQNKGFFFKNAQNPFPSQISLSQGHTDIVAGNSGYSQYEMCVTLTTGTQLTLGSVFIAGIVTVS